MEPICNIRILLAEDVPTDAELVLIELQKASIQCCSTRVDTETDFLAALKNFKPDLIISDYMMPAFDGMRALALAKRFAPKIPFIIMTGSMNEETAVACMKAGATDYVIKKHCSRLPFAVLEAVSQCREHEEKQATERMLLESEGRYTSLFRDNAAVMLIADSESLQVVDANPAACAYYGYSLSEFKAKKVTEFVLRPEPDLRANLAFLLKTNHNRLLARHQLSDGSVRDVEVFMGSLSSSERPLHYAIVHDITDRKRAESELESRARELARNQEATISSMAILSEYRDKGTGEHIRRTREYVGILLANPDARSRYPEADIELICQSASLHDIGKVGIPDTILLKPGRLSPEEFDFMKTHTLIGSQALKRTQAILGANSFLTYAIEITEFHHEKWDGSGYPHGLSGENIPYLGRVMAIADVYDALVTERPYKAAIEHETAVEIIRGGSGEHFDPGLVAVFMEHEAVFAAICAVHRD